MSPRSGLDAGDLEQVLHGVGRLRAAAEPEPRLLGVDVHQRRLHPRVVAADGVDRGAVARPPGVGDDDPVDGILVRAVTHEPDLDSHLTSVRGARGTAASYRGPPAS